MLRACLAVADKGHVRRRRSEDLANQVSCLNLVTHAVILWNTVYMSEVVAQLRREGSRSRPPLGLWRRHIGGAQVPFGIAQSLPRLRPGVTCIAQVVAFILRSSDVSPHVVPR